MNTVAKVESDEWVVYAPHKKCDMEYVRTSEFKRDKGVVIDINPVLDARRKENKEKNFSIDMEEVKEFLLMTTPFLIVVAGIYITYLIGR